VCEKEKREGDMQTERDRWTDRLRVSSVRDREKSKGGVMNI
jgi:hypothetical protein